MILSYWMNTQLTKAAQHFFVLLKCIDFKFWTDCVRLFSISIFLCVLLLYELTGLGCFIILIESCRTKMDQQIRCSYCLQELNDMRDPRQLSCSHIFCMSCIQADCQQQDGIKCPICGYVFLYNLCKTCSFFV